MKTTLEKVAALMRDCGALIRDIDRSELKIDTKSGRANFVTEYDKLVQERLQAGLRAIRPDVGFVGEEGSSVAYAKPFMGVSSGAMVYGDKGIMYFDAFNNVTLFDFKGNELRKFEEPARSQPGAGQSRTGGGDSDPTPAHFNNFMEAIRRNDPLMARSNAEIGTKSTYLALTANVAQRTGGALKIDVKTGRPVGNAAATALWNREYEKGWELA